MTQGSKYYSMNGKLTKFGKQAAINDITIELDKFTQAQKSIGELELTKNDYDVMTEIIQRRITDCRNKLRQYK